MYLSLYVLIPQTRQIDRDKPVEWRVVAKDGFPATAMQSEPRPARLSVYPGERTTSKSWRAWGRRSNGATTSAACRRRSSLRLKARYGFTCRKQCQSWLGGRLHRLVQDSLPTSAVVPLARQAVRRTGLLLRLFVRCPCHPLDPLCSGPIGPQRPNPHNAG